MNKTSTELFIHSSLINPKKTRLYNNFITLFLDIVKLQSSEILDKRILSKDETNKLQESLNENSFQFLQSLYDCVLSTEYNNR